MRHIRQRRWADCGAAAIAIVARVAYERVLESVAPDFFIHGLWYGEILHTLYKITGSAWSLVEYAGEQTVSTFDFASGPLIVCVERPEMKDYWARHYAVVAEGVLYDPLLKEPITLDEARTDHHAEWRVFGVITRETAT